MDNKKLSKVTIEEVKNRMAVAIDELSQGLDQADRQDYESEVRECEKIIATPTRGVMAACSRVRETLAYKVDILRSNAACEDDRDRAATNRVARTILADIR